MNQFFGKAGKVWFSFMVMATMQWGICQEPGAPAEAEPPVVVDEVAETPLPLQADEVEKLLVASEGRSAQARDQALQPIKTDLAQARRRLDAVPPAWLTWFTLAAALGALVSVLLIARQSNRQAEKQLGALKHTQLELDAVSDQVAKLPSQFPRLQIDPRRLAEGLGPHLAAVSQQPPPPPPTAPPEPGVFFKDEVALPKLAESPLKYLRYLELLRGEVGQFYQSLESSEDPGEALALVSWMLSRFHTHAPGEAAQRWTTLLGVAQEEGVICDRALSARMEQAGNHEERRRAFHRALYRDVFETEISRHLILLEELRQLPNFSGSDQSYAACQSVAERVAPMVTNFLSQTQELAGYHPHYVPLFSEISDDAAPYVRNRPTESLPVVYRNLTLPRRRVLCVLSYGLRRDRGWENEDTQVILS